MKLTKIETTLLNYCIESMQKDSHFPTNKEMAAHFMTGIKTIQFHTQNIRGKMGLQSTIDCVLNYQMVRSVSIPDA